MDKWLVNMAAGATLSALLVIFGASTFFDIVYPTGGGPEAEPQLASVDAHGGTAGGSAGGTAEPAADAPSFDVLLASASVDEGAKQAKKCAACHGFEAGGPNKIGPNLHGVVGRPVASHEGFAYSNALTEFGGSWDYERLSCFLINPKDCVPGNKMGFAGISKDSARADLIAYLRSVSPDAPPFPQPTDAASAQTTPGGAGTETAPAATTETPPTEASAVPPAHN